MSRNTMRICAVLVAGTTSSIANAQTADGNVFEIAFEIEARHESNVANASGLRAQSRNLVQEEQIISPATTLAIKKTIGPHSVRLDGYLGYDFHTENSQLDSERIAVAAGGRLAAGFCDLDPEITYARRQSELGDQVSFANPIATVDNTQSEQGYSAFLSCGRPIGLRAEAGIGFNKGDNSNALRQTSDYETFNYSVGLGYRQPSIGKMSVYLSKQETEFPNRSIGALRDEYEVSRYGASFERDIGARLSGKAEVFYIDVESLAQIGSDFSGLGFRLDLTAVVASRLQARLNFSRDVQTALNNDALYTLEGVYGLDLNYAINDRLSLNTAYVLKDRDYVYSTAVSPAAALTLTEDKTHTITGSLTYKQSPALSFSLFGGYENRQANGTFFDYDGFFAGITARYVFGR